MKDSLISPPRRITIVSTAFIVVFIAYVALAAFPPGPQPPSPGLDPSWVAGLNLAHAQGLVAGRDWVFTYGPFGYLTVPEPESGALNLGLYYRAGICAIWCCILLVLAIRAPSMTMGLWVAAVFGAVALIDRYMWIDRLELTIAAVALLPIWKRTEWRYVELSLLALVAAFATMVKLNTGAEAIALFFAVYGITLWSDRDSWPGILSQAVVPVGVLILASAGLYAAASGDIRSFGSYLYYGWQITAAYSESMTLIGPRWQLQLAGSAMAVPVLVLSLSGEARRRYLTAILPAGVITFFFFRHAFARPHESRVISLLAQLAIALLFATAYSRDRRDRTIIALLQMLFLLISLEMSFSADPHASQALKARLTLRSAIRQLPTYLHPDQTRIALASAGDVNLAGLRLDERFHRIIGSGTVESVPWDVVSVRANGWNWSPRPVFQTYQACRPSLDLLNAEHLQSRRAADFIVVGWGEIDGRHQFLSDPGSWRAMLDWYDLALATDDHLLLRRRSTPRFGTPHEIGYTTARWNEEIMIPQDDQLLMSVEIRRSVRGVLASLLFGNAPVYASVSYRSGQKERWRAVAANLAAGFPISALPRNLSALALLWDGKAPVDLAATIRFESDQVSEYGDTLVIHWRQLPGRTEQ